MRTLNRNKRKFYYANYLGEQPLLDKDGYETGEMQIAYSEPTEYYGNVSASVGQDSINVFGTLSNYSRTIVLTTCPFRERSKVWIGREPTEDANYTVVKIADSLNSYMVAINENSN